MATPDRTLAALASYTAAVSLALDAPTLRGAKVALIDSVAVALGALAHPAAVVARRYARHASVPEGATLWGSGETVTAEAATLANGVPLRGYDYNDLYMGRAGGHPSDLVPGLVALAEWRGLGGARLLQAIALGFEVTLELFDAFDTKTPGWDYPVVVAIGAACGAARLLGLGEAATREAIAITVIPHFPSDEVESGDLNARGDLTMWKRFNGSDAVRHAVYACLLAEAGAEGAVRPFEGRAGFLAKVPTSDEALAAFHARLDPRRPLSRITHTTFKRWPVGSRAQSAIQAALAARACIGDPWTIREVRVRTDEGAYDHLVRRRADPWHPISRETADHSLPYIVAAALLDGAVRPESFDPDRVREPRRQAFLAERVRVEPDRDLAGGARRGFLTRVEVVDANGAVHAGAAEPPPGHRERPFTDADFDAKLLENVAPLFGDAHAKALLALLWSSDSLDDVRRLTRRFVIDDAARIVGGPP
jgi:2-methylcitrate dehydratase